jgi:hypothetical protein
MASTNGKVTALLALALASRNGSRGTYFRRLLRTAQKSGVTNADYLRGRLLLGLPPDSGDVLAEELPPAQDDIDS